MTEKDTSTATPENASNPEVIESKLEELVKESGHAQGLSPGEERRLLQKIDIHLLPVMSLNYLFLFLDKVCLSYASIIGIIPDLHLSGNEYNWAGSIYYFGFLVSTPIACMLLVRLPVAKVIASTTLIWGAIVMMTALCTNFSGLLAARFFLGVSESAIAPGLMAIVAMWYKREEQPIRQGAWFMGDLCASFFGSLVAYALAQTHSLPPWKLAFLVYGSCTVAFSSIVFWLLPDTPESVVWLNHADRAKAVIRVQSNLTGIASNTWKKNQFIEAILDPIPWFLTVMLFLGSVPNNGLGIFQALIIKGFDFTTLDTLLIQMAPYGFGLVVVFVNVVGSSYFKNSRTTFVICDSLIAVAGGCMVRYIDIEYKIARLIGLILTSAFIAVFPMVMALLSSNCGGFTKKMTAGAMVFIGYCAGNIIGPFFFFARQAPVYQSGFEALIICFALMAGTTLLLRLYCIGENRKRDRKGGGLPVQELDQLTLTLRDVTDRQTSQFRYVY